MGVRRTDDAGQGPAGHELNSHELSSKEACARLGVDGRTGLTAAAAAGRLAQYGPNRPAEEKHEPWWEELLEELREPTVLLLLFTGVLYTLWGKLEDAITIFAVILLVAGVELFNELRAKKAIGALGKLAEPTAAVRREGHTAEVPVEQLVPGDVILLEAGRRVPADARLLEAYGLSADESSLTGEPAPVEKDAGLVLPAETPMAERRNLVFAGTVIARGRAVAVVADHRPRHRAGPHCRAGADCEAAQDTASEGHERAEQFHGVAGVGGERAGPAAGGASGAPAAQYHASDRPLAGLRDDSRRAAGHHHPGAGPGRIPALQTAGHRQAVAGRRDAGGRHRHRDRQDRHADREPDGGPASCSRRLWPAGC